MEREEREEGRSIKYSEGGAGGRIKMVTRHLFRVNSPVLASLFALSKLAQFFTIYPAKRTNKLFNLSATLTKRQFSH